MKKICAWLVVAASLAIAVPSAQPVAAPDIRLVLLIAVDQFRYDYLTRFRSEYTDGFKQLLTQGRRLYERQPRTLPDGHRRRARDDAERCDAVGEWNHRQRLVRS